jgi:hypothetical protein
MPKLSRSALDKDRRLFELIEQSKDAHDQVCACKLLYPDESEKKKIKRLLFWEEQIDKEILGYIPNTTFGELAKMYWIMEYFPEFASDFFEDISFEDEP